MERFALYPYSSKNLPIVLYINDYIANKKVTTLISLRGSGLCGNDAGCADNRDNIGLTVTDDIYAESSNWDTLLIDYNNEIEEYNGLLLQIINDAYDLRKNVICSILLDNNLKSLYIKKFASAGRYFKPAMGLEFRTQTRSYGKILSIYPFTILVCGAIGRANEFEVFLKIVGTLKKNLKILAFSSNTNASLAYVESYSSIIYDQKFSAIEKVYNLNDYFVKRTTEEKPDVVVIHIEDALLEYNDSLPNGFGLYPFLLSKAVRPNFVVFAAPYTLREPSILLDIKDGVLSKFDLEIDYFHLANIEIDASIPNASMNDSIVFTPLAKVLDILDKSNVNNDFEVCYGNLLSVEAFKPLVNMIESAYEENNNMKSII